MVPQASVLVPVDSKPSGAHRGVALDLRFLVRRREGGKIPISKKDPKVPVPIQIGTSNRHISTAPLYLDRHAGTAARSPEVLPGAFERPALQLVREWGSASSLPVIRYFSLAKRDSAFYESCAFYGYDRYR